MLTVKYNDNNMLYYSEDGIPLKIALRQCQRLNQYLTVLYLDKEKFEYSFDISYQGDKWDAFNSKYGKFIFPTLDDLCNTMEKIHNNRIFF